MVKGRPPNQWQECTFVLAKYRNGPLTFIPIRSDSLHRNAAFSGSGNNLFSVLDPSDVELYLFFFFFRVIYSCTLNQTDAVISSHKVVSSCERRRSKPLPRALTRITLVSKRLGPRFPPVRDALLTDITMIFRSRSSCRALQSKSRPALVLV